MIVFLVTSLLILALVFGFSSTSQSYATAMAGEAISVELAVQRERMMNNVKAVVPWVFLVSMFIVFLALAIRWSRVRPGWLPFLLRFSPFV